MARRPNGRARAVATRRFRASDGTQLTWREAGTTDGPTLLFLSGLGGGFGVWNPFVERFAGTCRLIGWDYRGLYESDTPELDALTMDHQIGDLLALIDHAEVEAPILVGWSMGVQLGLELHRHHGEIPRALIGIHGTSGRPLDTAFDSPWSARAGPAVLALLSRVERRFDEVGPRLVDAPGVARAFTWLCRGLGLMTPSIDLDAFRAMARDWTRLDFAAYARTFVHLAGHDAGDLLAKIETPTLIIAGDRDSLTPPHTAERIVRAMPDAELVLVPGASHFGLLEQPAASRDHTARFLTERLHLEV